MIYLFDFKIVSYFTTKKIFLNVSASLVFSSLETGYKNRYRGPKCGSRYLFLWPALRKKKGIKSMKIKRQPSAVAIPAKNNFNKQDQ